jgi:hypothetical protein
MIWKILFFICCHAVIKIASVGDCIIECQKL